MHRSKGIVGGLLILALIGVGCEGPERLKTHTYRFSPTVDTEASEEYQKVYAAEYGTWFFRRLLYGADEVLAVPGRRKFIRPSSARGAVSVRDTALQQQRLEVYLQSIAGAEIDLSRLEPGVVYVFRAQLFEGQPRNLRDAHIRARYVRQVATDLGDLLQLPEKSATVAEWSRHCLVHDRWQGWLDLFCTPQKWPEVRTFMESLRPPEPFFSYDSLFDPNNAALYYYRAADYLHQAAGSPARFDTGVFTWWKAPEVSALQLEEALKPYDDALATVLLARPCPECDPKPILPDTPDSPQPCPRDEMLGLARLLAAQSLYLDLLDRQQEALESALTIVKMSCDWNQGPICHRQLGADIMEVGCRSVARFFSQSRSRALCQQASDEILRFCRSSETTDFDTFAESVKPYHFEANFESLVIQDSLNERIQDAFVRTQVASVQAEVLLLRALVLAFRRDRGEVPEQLDALVPTLVDKLPKDPFTEGPLSYRVTGRVPQIYSWGPDRRDNYGSLPYDPTNGVLSAGDIYFP